MAPPPLPLTPQSPSIGTSRAGTSSAIQSAHAALTEKARESGFVSSALAKRNERDLAGEAAAQGFGPTAACSRCSLEPFRDLSLMIEGVARDSSVSTPRSPDKSTRPSTPSRGRDPYVDSRLQDERNDKACRAISHPRTQHHPNHTANGPAAASEYPRREHPSPVCHDTMLALQNMATPSAMHREPTHRSRCTETRCTET